MRRLLALGLLGLLLPLLAPPAAAQDEVAPQVVRVGILAINFGNYDVNRGTYVVDFYLWFRWSPQGPDDTFTPERFEFMNGRASSKEKIFDGTTPTGAREVWYRIQANLYTDPEFGSYPFDTQRLQIVLEDAVHTADALRYEPILDESGLDEGFRVSGFRIRGWEAENVPKTYAFEETYDRLVFTVTISREVTSTLLKSFLPPLAFVLVAGLGFLLHPSKVANRLTLGTSMLIAAVMFHISQTVSLPPLGMLILFDKVMIAVYAFLACTLAVATLIAIDEDYWKDRDHTRAINRWGVFASLLLPVLVFLLLVGV